MKEYLIALKALMRNCKLLRDGAQIPASSIVYYTTECLTQFKSVFGDVQGTARVADLLTAANEAATNNDVTEYLRLIDAANITFEP